MNPDPQLESLMDRELKSLPPLTAPASLAPRVLAALQRRAPLPWYRRAWQTWPAAGQAVSLAALSAACVAICWAGWQVAHAGFARPAAGAWDLATVVASVAAALGQALLLTVKHANPLWITGALLVLGTGWLSCVGLGTALFRLARPQPAFPTLR